MQTDTFWTDGEYFKLARSHFSIIVILVPFISNCWALNFGDGFLLQQFWCPPCIVPRTVMAPSKKMKPTKLQNVVDDLLVAAGPPLGIIPSEWRQNEDEVEAENLTDGQLEVDVADAGAEDEELATFRRIEERLWNKFREAESTSNAKTRAQAEAAMAKAKASQQGNLEEELLKYQTMLKEVTRKRRVLEQL